MRMRSVGGIFLENTMAEELARVAVEEPLDFVTTLKTKLRCIFNMGHPHCDLHINLVDLCSKWHVYSYR